MQVRWLANEDPIRMQAFEEMPMLEYLMLLNQRIEDLLKESSRSKRGSRL
jgi:hypothetical protein